MVVTHKQIMEKKKKPIYVKPNNPKRKFMSHADAVADNERIREENAAIEKFASDLRNKRKVDSVEKVTISDVVVPDNSAEIAKREAQIAEEKGPGSKARKDKLQAKIDGLKG